MPCCTTMRARVMFSSCIRWQYTLMVLMPTLGSSADRTHGGLHCRGPSRRAGPAPSPSRAPGCWLCFAEGSLCHSGTAPLSEASASPHARQEPGCWLPEQGAGRLHVTWGAERGLAPWTYWTPSWKEDLGLTWSRASVVPGLGNAHIKRFVWSTGARGPTTETTSRPCTAGGVLGHHGAQAQSPALWDLWTPGAQQTGSRWCQDPARCSIMAPS